MKTVALLALVASVASAQVLPPAGVGANGSPIVTQAQLWTQGAMQFYVVADGGGNDGSPNTCLSASSPCQTIQGAYNKKPKGVRHPVVINEGCGSYDGGAYVEGDLFWYDPYLGGGFNPGTDAGWYPSIVFNGTTQAATASGLMSGTVASATQGGTSAPQFANWGTMSVTGAAWTPGALTNLFVSITGGPDVGETRPIQTNDAGALTINGTWTTAPTSSSTFAIVQPCTTVNDSLTTYRTPIQGSLVGYAHEAGAAYIVAEGNGTFGVNEPTVFIQNQNILVAANNHDGIAVLPNSNVEALNVVFQHTGSATTSASRALFHTYGTANGVVISSVFSPTNSINGINVATGSSPPLPPSSFHGSTGNLIARWNTFNFGGTAGTPIYLPGPVQAGTTQNNILTGSSRGIWMGGSTLTSVGDYISTGASTAAVSMSASEFGSSSSLNIFGITLQGNSGTGAQGIYDNNTIPTVVSFFDGNSSITGFACAYQLNGPYFLINGGFSGHLPTPSGSTTADICFTLSGVNYSMATLNALSPKVLMDPVHNAIISNE